ncbi:MAG: ATP-grasp domain-containing protein [Xanthobacteraceae bacterium]|nr:ATP-grasp domain-containing protein [Xanthobacteraceae bacterium]
MRFAASPRPIRSVLVANRGEIALRVIRTCARLGLRTVAVYSDADAGAPHVAAADEALRLGPAPARESYLDMEALLAAAARAEADAIHPGYGFLSENAEFARRCAAAGLIFVGPSPEAVARMGSKIEAKRIADEAGVPTVPGFHGEAQDRETLARAAARIGYPVLIKASAGGGGRGMRRVDRPQDFAAAHAAARKEAEAAFGDGSLLIEKLILAPRHLEVQVAGDRLGGLVHLFERDCSVQRNNQKVIEETPAPDLPAPVRTALHAAALKLCRAIGYDSVGTVEFIMEAGGSEPYFLEMNTRLQVEHPVTELVTGIDLVEWQLVAAAGEPLPLGQEQIRAHGHAIEVRLTAERADREFQPVTGRIEAVAPPRGARFDSGVGAGSSVGLHYDSMLAKLIAHGRSRELAIGRLAAGLSDLSVLGLPTTQTFLRDALRHPLFTGGAVTTRFIATAFPGGWSPDPAELRRLRAAAAAAWILPGAEASGWQNPWMRRSAMRVTRSTRPATADLRLLDEYGEAELRVRDGRDGLAVEVDGELVELGRISREGDRLVTQQGEFPLRRVGDRVMIARGGLAIDATVGLRIEAAQHGGEPERAGNRVAAPLHGVISQIYVAKGDTVAEGAPVVQMEAMKLVHTLLAPLAGTVAEIRCAVGETVPSGAVLVDIFPAAEEQG